MMIGDEDIASDLRALGVMPGDGLFVHTAMGQVGRVIGGPRGFIQGLLKAVGPDGLIGMPGFSRDAYDPVDLEELTVTAEEHASIRRQVPGYDPMLSDTRQNGAVPEAFRSWPGMVRSPHPTSSVLFLGPDAPDFATPHDPMGWPTGPDTPWARLGTRPRMKVLLIGVGWNRCSAFHAAETAAGHKRITTRNLKLGTGPDAPWVTAPDVADDLGRIFPAAGDALEETGQVTTGKVGNAEARLTDYAGLLVFATAWIAQRNKADRVPPSTL